MEHEIIGEVAKAALETTVIYGSGSVDKKGPGPRAKVAHRPSSAATSTSSAP